LADIFSLIMIGGGGGGASPEEIGWEGRGMHVSPSALEKLAGSRKHAAHSLVACCSL